MDTCSCEQVFQEILDEGLLLRGQVIENGVWWIFEIYSIAFSLRYLPPNIPEDPRFIKEIYKGDSWHGGVFVFVFFSYSLKHAGSRVQSLMYRKKVFLSHWFFFFNISICTSFFNHMAVSQRCGNL